MRRQLYTFILFLLIVTTDIAQGKEGNKHKTQKTNHKIQHHKDKVSHERIKRSLLEDRDKKFVETINDEKEKDTKDPPFWGSRGRRDSSSSENYDDLDYTDEHGYVNRYLNKCVDCLSPVHKLSHNYVSNRRNDISPFWRNRGRRNSDEDYSTETSWGSRGRREENDPFWGNRGKKEDEPFWGNRGKKEDEPFWGNRGRRDDEPFWGNRGRREDVDPFWGNRGRRQDTEPFSGNKGRRDDEPFWDNRGWRKIDYKERKKATMRENIFKNFNDVENDIEKLSRLRRSHDTNFWMNRGRESKLNYLFTSHLNRRNDAYLYDLVKTPEADTVHDSRIYADEPNYVLIERSSRSSGEDDPFFISRGKKYYLNYNLIKAARNRRGAIEEIVKSVRNDPYYVVRGKKDLKNGSVENSNMKEFICSAIDLFMVNNKYTKLKRETDDRDRRTVLKNIAAQLQNDPYFVTRGKKNGQELVEFIYDIANKCNN